MEKISRRQFMAGLGAAAAAAALPALARAQSGGKKPNIIYYIADELGYFELSCMGHPEFKTPNFDRMAAEGMRFTNYYAGSAVCAPVRCTLLTGKHSGHASVRNNGTHESIQAGEATLGSMLKAAGYATGGFGKWGNGGRGSAGAPEKHGFDVFFGYYDQSHAHSYYPAYLVRNSQEVPQAGNKVGLNLTGGTYSHYVIVDEAKKWLRENKDRPFFLYLAWTPPHGSFAIPETDPSWALYKDKPWPDSPKVYASMVNMIDRTFGEIMAMLKEFGLDDNTVVFFSGDNGGLEYFKDAEHPYGFFGPNVNPKTGKVFKRGKTTIWEGGIKTPLIARWPGRIKSGQVTDQMCWMPDIMPTLAELGGAECPKDTDGYSIVPTLTGQGTQKTHNYFYWEFSQMTAVRMGNWKGIQPTKNAPWELYDISAEVEEKNNLAEAHPEILAKMKAIAEQAHTEQVSGEVFDVALNDSDRASVYPNKPSTGRAPNAKGQPAAATAAPAAEKATKKKRNGKGKGKKKEQ